MLYSKQKVRGNSVGQKLFTGELVVLVLAFEELPAWHGHDSDADTLLTHGLGDVHTDLHLGPCVQDKDETQNKMNRLLVSPRNSSLTPGLNTGQFLRHQGATCGRI